MPSQAYTICCWLVKSACCVQEVEPEQHAQSARYYLLIYTAFAVALMVANVLRNVIAVWGSYKASKAMHARLLGHVLLLPMAFFDSQPLGRLLNRFTKDTEAVDVELLHLVCAVLCCAVLCCAVLCCAVLCCAVLCCGPEACYVCQSGRLWLRITAGHMSCVCMPCCH